MTESEKTAHEAVKFFSDKLGFMMACSRLKQIIDSGDKSFEIIDARHRGAFIGGHVPGARFVNIDKAFAEWKLEDKEKIYVFYCYSDLCHRAAKACLTAALEGYKVMELHGGYEGWAEYPMPVEK